MAFRENSIKKIAEWFQKISNIENLRGILGRDFLRWRSKFFIG